MKRILTLSSVAIFLATVNLFAQPAIRQISQQYDFWDSARTPAIVGNIALVPTTDTGLRILDISDPNNPTQIGIYEPDCSVIKVAASGDVAVITLTDPWNWDNDNESEIQVLDISDPRNPALLSRIDIHYDEGWNFYPHFGMKIVDSKLCMVGRSMMVVVDLINPSHPREMFRTTAEQFWEFDIRDDYIFVGSRDTLGVASLKVFDYSNFEPVSTLEFGWLAADILLSGSYVYIETEEDWAVVSIPNPREPYEVARLEALCPIGEYPVIASDELMVTVRMDSLAIYDLEDPFIPRKCGSLKLSMHSDLFPVFCEDNLLAVSQSYYGFSIVDISDWENLVELGSYPPPGEVQDVEVIGQYAYVAVQDGGLDVWNVSDPVHPRRVSQTDFGIPVDEIVPYGDALYITNPYSGVMMIVDLSVPFEPRHIDLGDSINVYRISAGNGLLATWGDNGNGQYSEIRLLDLTDPLAPVFVGECPGEEYFTGFGFIGHFLIATNHGFEPMDNEFDNIYSFDVSDPRNPVLVDTIQLNVRLTDFVIGENFAYISYRDSDWENQIDSYGVYVIDITDEGELAILNEIETDGRGFHVPTIVGDRLIFGRWGGFSIWDISDPAYPEPVVDYDKEAYIRGLSYRNGLVYTAEEYNFCIYDCSDFLEVPPEMPFILQPSDISLSAFPNPFNSSTTINYSLPAPGRYAIDVIDIQGRLVRRLGEGWKEAGSYHDVLNGNEFPSGELILKLSDGFGSQFQTIQLVK